MIEFVKSALRGFFEVILWINLILNTIGGGIIGNGMGGHPIIGGIMGLIIGLLINIVGGGFIAIILNMDENFEQLIYNMKNGLLSVNLGNISSSNGRTIIGNKIQKKCKRCKREVDEDYTGCPHCGNNTFE
jgi:hypothetical protein